jgi:MYXO-CTERM domain-containing protein
VYSLGELPPTYKPTIVSAEVPSSSALSLGPVFFIALGVLAMIRRRRESLAIRNQKKIQIESMLLPKITT